KAHDYSTALYGFRISADTLLLLIAIWKSLLYLPAVALAFVWGRSIYNAPAGWAAAVLLLIEPTLAAHTPLPTLDVLGVEAILFGCYFSWRCFQRPSARRLIVACFTIALALSIKHTAIILPAVVAIYAVIWRRPKAWRERVAALIFAPILIFIFVRSLMFFDMSLYLSSVAEGFAHADKGHVAYLFGRISKSGWWYYFPVVATYKVPIGIGLLLMLSTASLAIVRPRWDELSLLIPMIAWGIFMMCSPIDIGWRHFLP